MDNVLAKRSIPSWNFEHELFTKGHRIVAGVDEAGRGAWAGPLVAGAVVLPRPEALLDAPDIATSLAELRDSKMLTANTRERLIGLIHEVAVGVGVGIVSSALIDIIGIGPANRLAWVRALRSLSVQPDHLLLDAFKLPAMRIPQKSIIRGDAVCISIAAASVVAKVTRDRIMHEMEATYPGYGFARHKGYGTRLHSDSLKLMGVAPVHRKSFAPIKAALLGQFLEINEITLEELAEEELVVA